MTNRIELAVDVAVRHHLREVGAQSEDTAASEPAIMLALVKRGWEPHEVSVGLARVGVRVEHPRSGRWWYEGIS